MFVKKPVAPIQLPRARSGLLSQLMNPDPELFPPNHPYRTTQSTQDMTQLGNQQGGGGSGVSDVCTVCSG